MPTDPKDAPRGRLWKVGEVADLCAVSENTVRLWIGRGLLRASKLGGEWRLRREDVEAFIASGQKQAAG